MTPATLAIVLFVGGVLLLLAEVALPAHGVIGLLGAAALLGGVVVCFTINQWLGLGTAVALVAAAPFAGALWVKVWPKTPVGRRLILQPAQPGGAPAPAVKIGDVGNTLTELRPNGLCMFDGERVEARSEYGIVPAGQRVTVVAMLDGRPTVRAVATS